MAELGIAAGPEAFGEIDAKLDFLLGEAGAKGADVRVEGEQLGAFHAIKRDAFQHVRSGTAEADDFDGGGGDDLVGIAGVGDHGALGFEI